MFVFGSKVQRNLLQAANCPKICSSESLVGISANWIKCLEDLSKLQLLHSDTLCFSREIPCQRNREWIGYKTHEIDKKLKNLVCGSSWGAYL